MRAYGMFCGMAMALDVVGERWTLLIVRELLVRGAARYTDLRQGLPGIATNLLSDRLRELEEKGIVWRESAPPPVATTLYHLTPRGEALESVMEALGRWGGSLLPDAPDGAEFQSHWLALPMQWHLTDAAPERPPVTIEVRTGDEPLLIETVDGRALVRPGRAERPDAVLTGSHRVLASLFTGRITLAEARERGVAYEGAPATLRRVQPRA
jgi:DNA-binding HxlR family transcriptional regulator